MSETENQLDVKHELLRFTPIENISKKFGTLIGHFVQILPKITMLPGLSALEFLIITPYRITCNMQAIAYKMQANACKMQAISKLCNAMQNSHASNTHLSLLFPFRYHYKSHGLLLSITSNKIVCLIDKFPFYAKRYNYNPTLSSISGTNILA